MRALHHQVAASDKEPVIEVLPWARAMNIANQEPNVLLFATSINEQRRQEFDFVGPIAETRIQLYARMDDDFTPADLSQAVAAGNIALYRNSPAQILLKSVSDEQLLISGFPQYSARQLLHKRVRYWCQADIAVQASCGNWAKHRRRCAPYWNWRTCASIWRSPAVRLLNGSKPGTRRYWHCRKRANLTRSIISGLVPSLFTSGGSALARSVICNNHCAHSGGFDPVATSILGAIEGIIGLFQQLGELQFLTQSRDPGTYRHSGLTD